MPAESDDPRRSQDPRKDLRHFADMLSYAEDAIGFMEGRTLSDLTDDRMLQFAVIRAIEVIGEASRNISAVNIRRWDAIP